VAKPEQRSKDMILEKITYYIGYVAMVIILLSVGDIFNFIGKLQSFLISVMR